MLRGTRPLVPFEILRCRGCLFASQFERSVFCDTCTMTNGCQLGGKHDTALKMLKCHTVDVNVARANARHWKALLIAQPPPPPRSPPPFAPRLCTRRLRSQRWRTACHRDRALDESVPTITTALYKGHHAMHKHKASAPSS
jgi:hypothetical protein